MNPASNKVLLVRAISDERRGYSGWTWPKGGVEPGERFRDAALREVREEAGIVGEILPVQPIRVRSHGKVSRRYFLMSAKADLGKTDREISERQWVSLDQAAQLLQRPRDRRVLRKARQQIRDVRRTR